MDAPLYVCFHPLNLHELCESYIYFWRGIRLKCSSLDENFETSPILGENRENTQFWTKMPFLGKKFRKYPILGENPENTPFGQKCTFLGENSENAPFWAKIPKIRPFGRKSQNYPILRENHENTPFWAKISKIPHFRQKKFPLLGRKYLILAENAPFWAKISKIPHCGRKCPFLCGNFENTPTLCENPEKAPFYTNILLNDQSGKSSRFSTLLLRSILWYLPDNVYRASFARP